VSSTPPPGRTPANPFARPDLEAEAAICGAFVVLDYRGETSSAWNVGRRAKLMLQAQTATGLDADAAKKRIIAALIALEARGALDVANDIQHLCRLNGDALHPELRAHLGLRPVKPPPPLPPSSSPRTSSSTRTFAVDGPDRSK
jgi:hypothetical protein